MELTRRELLALGALAAAGQSAGATEARSGVDVTRLTASEISASIRDRRLSSLEIVNACIARIEQVNPRLNAVVSSRADDARRDAEQADALLARGGRVGPLHGVPMTIKDSFDTAGLRSTYGTTGRASFVPTSDAVVVARLKAAGAILLGKTNTPEFTWSFETDNLVFGRTNNPWDVTLSPGGSSGGSAAIVAAHGVPFDIGTDSGGSIRVPAHFCGVAGLKPTAGRVPRTGHAVGFDGYLQSLTHVGPIARSVADLELIYGIIAGPDGRDPFVVEVPRTDSRSVAMKGLRIAVHADNGVHAPAPSISQAVTKVADGLESAGARITSSVPSPLGEVMEIDDLLYHADGYAWLRRLLERAGTREPGPDVAPYLDYEALSPAEFSAAIERWDNWRSRMLQWFEPYDAIICPVSAFDELPHGAEDGSAAYAGFSYTFAYNLTGWPAAVVRAGTSPKGRPIGIQVIGRPWQEHIILALASEIERRFGGYVPPPDQKLGT
ncbi:MAG TPA: amidase [Steroidobacteraceae bacterium]|nr:amidase [Steroidobacteraceae bacterium]